MRFISVEWSDLPCDHGLFVVSHDTVRPEFSEHMESVLVIPDMLTDTPPVNCRLLMTERYRRRTGYAGEGVSVVNMPFLDDGDIVSFDGVCKRIEIVFQVRSHSNSLYVTNICNSRCQFCPQPSTPDDGRLYADANRIIDLVADAGPCVNVTGGEPTLQRRLLVDLLRHAAEKWKGTKTFVLTNGRMLSDRGLVDEMFLARGDEELGFGIPLYSDSAEHHDFIVGAKGAFAQTIRGLYNLSRHHAEIEIRIVVSKLTYERLPRLIEFVGRNVPFVTRIAVMGIEPMGYCRERWTEFWIDPADCASQLLGAAHKASNFGLNMLLYNFQLCCLPPEIRHLACSSISEWKRTYVERCLSCPMKAECGGFFASQDAGVYRPRLFLEG